MIITKHIPHNTIQHDNDYQKTDLSQYNIKMMIITIQSTIQHQDDDYHKTDRSQYNTTSR